MMKWTLEVGDVVCLVDDMKTMVCSRFFFQGFFFCPERMDEPREGRTGVETLRSTN